LFAFTIHIARRAIAIALGARSQNLKLLHCNNCISAKAHIIEISLAYHAGSECNKAQDHIIYNIGIPQQFHSARAQHFIWFMLTFDHLDLRQGTRHNINPSIILMAPNNDKALCASARRLHVTPHNGNNNKALCASARHFNVVLHDGGNVP
jgi:hypothetical protein